MDPKAKQRKGASSQAKSAITKSSPAPQSSFLRTVVLTLLPLLSLAGVYGTWVLAGANGSIETLESLAKQNAPMLPGSTDLIVKTYTGNAVIDRQLIILVTFFSPVVDSKNTALFLSSTFGLGQFGAAWLIMMMEGLREGNKWRIVSFVGTFGFFVQNITFTVTVPIWAFLHLLTSPVAKATSGSQLSSALLISSLDLKILPLTLILGYLVPSVLMALPTPAVASAVAHQQFIALWQPFPWWCFIIQTSTKFIISAVSGGDSKKNKSKTAIEASYLNSAKGTYTFIITLCLATHLPVLLIAVLPPSVFANAPPLLQKFAGESFSSVYVPYFPSLAYKVSSFAAGVHAFLQWDFYIGGTALLLWGILLNRTAAQTIKGAAGWGSLFVKLATWLVLAGPSGALAVLLWERDAMVKQKTN